MGNEAIVRGALESGVNFVSTYPGTPASEIGNIFYKIQNSNSKIKNLYFEFSVNEKVALEAAIGASFSGLKTLVAMKNFGLNVCLDALFPFVYTRTTGPTVIIIADDPSCHSSAQSEENSRGVALSTHIPILEPSDPQECKDFVKLGYQISEKYNIPVMIRTTTRVAHQKAPVVLGKIPVSTGRQAKFVKNYRQFVTLPPRVMEMKAELLEKIKKIKEFAEKSSINSLIPNTKYKILNTKIGIIASGISYLHTMEALEELNISLPVLKIGFFNPLPEEKIKEIISLSEGKPGRILDFLAEPQKLDEEREKIKEIIKISNSDLSFRFQYVKKITESDENLGKILENWMRYFRNILHAAIGNQQLATDNGGYSLLKLQKILKTIESIDFLISSTNVSSRLALEMIMLEL